MADLVVEYVDGQKVMTEVMSRGMEVLIHDESLVEGTGLEYVVDPNVGVFVNIKSPVDFVTLLQQLPANEDGWIALKACSLTSQLIAIQ